ncbi:MAG TPA: hypothetical protein DCM62_01010 [Bacteroidales bacterium]|nr:hypothetical protein [Bacteroidales bacterium]
MPWVVFCCCRFGVQKGFIKIESSLLPDFSCQFFSKIDRNAYNLEVGLNFTPSLIDSESQVWDFIALAHFL